MTKSTEPTKTKTDTNSDNFNDALMKERKRVNFILEMQKEYGLSDETRETMINENYSESMIKTVSHSIAEATTAHIDTADSISSKEQAAIDVGNESLVQFVNSVFTK